MQVNLSKEVIITAYFSLKSMEHTLQYNLATGSKNLCGTMDEAKQAHTASKLSDVQEALKVFEELKEALHE